MSNPRASLSRSIHSADPHALKTECHLTRGGANAATEFPQAASANHAVFYRPDGEAKTVRDVYDWALRQPGA